MKRILCAETLIMVIGTAIVLATKGRTFLIPVAVFLFRAAVAWRYRDRMKPGYLKNSE